MRASCRHIRARAGQLVLDSVREKFLGVNNKFECRNAPN